MLTWKVQDAAGNTKFVTHGETEVGLVCTTEYKEGDKIILEQPEQGAYLWVQVDECLGRSLVYLTGNLEFTIPFGKNISVMRQMLLWENVTTCLRVLPVRRKSDNTVTLRKMSTTSTEIPVVIHTL